ncbi:hypothetical protein [Tsukamurella spumae]|uniref:Uncharacterized protein n=1 Tax=Tsukamurella spumae TaxID=44753 RepID=A0A846X4M7_9ACTN|nr:hypothetical protein [Tsukamurella spumae]NKY20334.1 hypothetical protein [Tsukamurella spumae]
MIVSCALGFAALAAVGGFVLGRSTAPRSAAPIVAAERTTLSPTIAAVPTGASTSVTPTGGITLTDSASDAQPHPVRDGTVYGPSDLTAITVTANGSRLVSTMTFKPGTNMAAISTEIAIRTDPDRLRGCDFSVLADSDWALSYDIDGAEILSAPSTCDGRWTSTSMSLEASVSGTTLTLSAPLSSLNLSAGQRVTVRGCASTRIDSTSSTFIQDYVPDVASGAVGTI